MSVVLLGSTSGSCTLQEQAVAGNTVLTLPTTSGTLITTGSSGQSIPKAALPTGSVLQVVSATYSTAVSTTSTSPVTTNLAASITPTSASSKVLVLVNLGGTGIDGNSVGIFYIYRGASAVATFHDNFYHNTTIPFFAPVSMSVLDSPATTSSTTYTIYFASGAGPSVNMNANSRSNSIITLLEIAA